MFLLDYRLTLEHYYGQSKTLIVLGSVAGLIGLGAELFLIFSKAKERWLVERFAAERLRCLKFQAFGLLPSNSDPTKLASDVELAIRGAVTHLDYELMGGRAALQEFSPAKFPLLHEADVALPDDVFTRTASDLYNTLRLQVQLQHFEERSSFHQEQARNPSALSEFAFAFGALLGLAGTITVGVGLLPRPYNAAFASSLRCTRIPQFLSDLQSLPNGRFLRRSPTPPANFGNEGDWSKYRDSGCRRTLTI
jgi:hypothetical protein